MLNKALAKPLLKNGPLGRAQRSSDLLESTSPGEKFSSPQSQPTRDQDAVVTFFCLSHQHKVTGCLQLGLNYFVKLFVYLTSPDPGNNSNQWWLTPFGTGVWLLYSWWQRGHTATVCELILNSWAACCFPARLYFFISYSQGPGSPRGCQSTLIFIITWNLSGLNGSTQLSGAFWTRLQLHISLGKTEAGVLIGRGMYKMHETFYCSSNLTMHLSTFPS